MIKQNSFKSSYSNESINMKNTPLSVHSCVTGNSDSKIDSEPLNLKIYISTLVVFYKF